MTLYTTYAIILGRYFLNGNKFAIAL